jgi:chemotaxis family two-component system response regulator Rcp1
LKQVLDVLLVEDSSADLRLVQEAIQGMDGEVRMDATRDGQAALDKLLSRCLAGAAFLPDVVLLDLNLPVLDGRELLRDIRNHELLKELPVVVMSSSASQRDLSFCYGLNISSYLIKPLDAEMFLDMIRVFVSYWRLAATASKMRRESWKKKQ